ncbi:MAG: electron transfer flavoprotein subunit beta/FixA family protein [Firmicutes bacterium]|nr:electron transfer flavoprotein subunit beta/FixA family protein [Bacillota bacterium]
MNIIVCVKQVPSTNEVRLDPVTGTIIRDGRNSVINPFDSYAIEEAVRLKEKLGGKVTALSMGIPATERLLRDAMARGVDEALLLTDRAFAGADTLATSYALSEGAKRIGAFDLIICGRMAVDGDTAQIGPELSRQLGINFASDVCGILSASEEKLVLKKLMDGGVATIELRLPAVITVTKDINMPRMASIAGVRYSLKAPFESLTADALGADKSRCGLNGSPTRVLKSFAPDRSHEALRLEGSPEELAAKAVKIAKEAL